MSHRTPREFTQPEPQRIHSGEWDPFTLSCKISLEFPTMEPVILELPARKTKAVTTRPAECTADGNRDDAQNGSDASGGREYRPGPNDPRSAA